MDLVSSLIDQIGPGHMPSTAYDTAWVARLGDLDTTLGNQALDWIGAHQLPDGSWGTEFPFYYHDRIISTLAAMIALTYRGRRSYDRLQIERGKDALERILSGATAGLHANPGTSTVGFEMIVPTLVSEAERLGVIQRQGERILGRLSQQRAKKLAHIRGKMINKHLTVAFSAEMVGTDGKHLLDVDNLQEANGSVGHSPSASSYFALYVRQNDRAIMEYLHRVVGQDGGAPNVAQFDVFEISWALWNLSLIMDLKLCDNIKTQIEFLKKAWTPHGVGFAAEYSVKDGDDTGLVFDTLLRFGCPQDIQSVLFYEAETHFRCYDLESDPSVSANIHILSALRQAGYDNKHPSVQKVFRFLQHTKGDKSYWTDKWHLSPYYATAHAIIACAGYADELVEDAVNYILSAQHENGGWGVIRPTAEETAYTLQALWIWNQKAGKVNPSVLKKGAKWLEEHLDDPYPPLWIGKCLYAPILVIRSAVISALALVQ